MSSASSNETGIPKLDRLLEYWDTKRSVILGVAFALIAVVAVADWRIQPNVSLGYL
jgi:hypothetical protein